MQRKIHLFSYNKFPEFSADVKDFIKKHFQIFDCGFNPKGPASVTDQDPVWQRFVSEKKEALANIIFIGKKESGALEMCALIKREFENSLESLMVVYCDCARQEKEALLAQMGLACAKGQNFQPCHNFTGFYDPNKPCDEWSIMLGKGLMLLR